MSAARVNGEVRIAVATGPGIALQDHERIFGEFQQTEAGLEQREEPASGSRSRSGSSSSGGRIWLESEPGSGNTFVSRCP